MSVAARILIGMANDRDGETPSLLGLATMAELLGSGIPPASLRARIRRGDLVAVSHGAYASAAVLRMVASLPAGDTVLACAAALVTTGPGAVASHHTAAAIHGLDLLGRPPSAIAISRAPGSGSRSGKQGVCVHTAELPAGHVTQCNGVPVTTVARTVIDVARASSFRAGVVTADSALRRRRTTRAEMAAVLADCARWPGVRTAAAVVAFADRRSESALESVARVVFRDCGLPPPELQVWLGDDEPVRVDFLWRQFRTIVEVDGAIKYTEFAADPGWRAIGQLRRDSYLRELGYEVVHFSWDDVNRDQARVVAVIRAAFRRGGALTAAG
jgi:very-short-patch-repair endonuclease